MLLKLWEISLINLRIPALLYNVCFECFPVSSEINGMTNWLYTFKMEIVLNLLNNIVIKIHIDKYLQSTQNSQQYIINKYMFN